MIVCLILGTTTAGVFGNEVVQTNPSAIAQKSSLNAKTQQALKEALADEYQARAFYQAVINKFGEVKPTFRRLVSKVNNIFGKRKREKTEYVDVQGLS